MKGFQGRRAVSRLRYGVVGGKARAARQDAIWCCCSRLSCSAGLSSIRVGSSRQLQPAPPTSHGTRASNNELLAYRSPSRRVRQALLHKHHLLRDRLSLSPLHLPTLPSIPHVVPPARRHSSHLHRRLTSIPSRRSSSRRLRLNRPDDRHRPFCVAH